MTFYSPEYLGEEQKGCQLYLSAAALIFPAKRGKKKRHSAFCSRQTEPISGPAPWFAQLQLIAGGNRETGEDEQSSFFLALFFFLSAITWDQSDTAPEPGRGAEGSLPLKAAAGLGDVQAAKPCSLCPPWKKSLLCCPAEGRKPRREGGSAPPEAPLSHRREFGGTGEVASTPGARSTPPCKSPKILLPHPRDKNKSQQLGRADQGSF